MFFIGLTPVAVKELDKCFHSRTLPTKNKLSNEKTNMKIAERGGDFINAISLVTGVSKRRFADRDLQNINK